MNCVALFVMRWRIWQANHPLQLFLQRIVEILFWFHPLIWWASRQAAWSREFHCDAAAVTTAERGGVLPRGLLRMAEQTVASALACLLAWPLQAGLP